MPPNSPYPHSLPEEQKRFAALKQIRDEVLALKASPLYAYRSENKYHPVIGEGSHFAKIMFIGEAPGKNEALTAKPFCGASGRVLDELLNSINVNRKDVYVTNIVKDRPPENRDPTLEEIELYAPFLRRQIEIIRPTIIATLGRFSMVFIMENYGLKERIGAISALHGKVFDAKTSYGTVKFIALYHPAVALYKASQKEVLKQDFQIIKTVIG